MDSGGSAVSTGVAVKGVQEGAATPEKKVEKGETKMTTVTMLKKKEVKDTSGAQTKVVWMNLPFDIAVKLAQEAKSEDRPISVQAGRIIKQYFDKKR